jgi:nucleoid-associated protein YgaU
MSELQYAALIALAPLATGALTAGISAAGAGIQNIPVSAVIQLMDPPYIPIPCQFNPSEIRFSRGTRWSSDSEYGWFDDDKTPPRRDVPIGQFKNGEAPRLKMTLFFDTTALGMDVRAFTDLLVALTIINPLTELEGFSRPSYVKFIWGMFSASMTMAFTAYIPDVNINFSMFLADGTPVRAEVEVEFVATSSMLPFQNPTSRSEARSIWVVTEGQTIDWIAAQNYGSPSQWRHIAKTNNLSNPKDLRPGQVLKITPLPR